MLCEKVVAKKVAEAFLQRWNMSKFLIATADAGV